jgi:hypothetical protein
LAGNSPKEAVKAFLDPLQKVISCFSRTAHLSHIGPYALEGGPYAMRVDKFKLPETSIYLTASMQYKIVEAKGELGPYKVTTTAYQYILEDGHESEILAYQWHPDGTHKFPHLHLGSSSRLAKKTINKLHLPTGRIALEQVLRLCVDELEAVPLNADWDNILSGAQKAFETWRTWSFKHKY